MVAAEPTIARARPSLLEVDRDELTQMLRYLAWGGDWDLVFEAIEKRGFLAFQADLLGEFAAAGENLEIHVLPGLIERRDWERFLHYSLLALNLRHLAESLADPVILRALAEGDRKALALDVVARIADPLRRAEARAVVAAAVRKEDPALFQKQRDKICDELGEDALPPPADAGEAGACAGSLSVIARLVGPYLEDWPAWLERLVPEPAAALEVRTAVAEGWLAALAENGPQSEDSESPLKLSGLWRALAFLDHLPTVFRILPDRLGFLSLSKLEGALESVEDLFAADPMLGARACVRILDRHSRGDPSAVRFLWECWRQSRRIPWSVDLVADGAALFGKLDEESLARVLMETPDSEVRAALLIHALEQHNGGSPAKWAVEAARAALRDLAPGAALLHWSLRYLAAPAVQQHEGTAAVQAQAASVLAYLARVRFAAPAMDVRRCLDLVAGSCDLPRILEDVSSSPATRPETLRVLAGEAEEERLLTCLLDQAERHAALVAENEAEGFRLRAELIRRLARRLCDKTRSLEALDAVRERLLPDEEDELRAELAADLAASGRQEDAAQVCGGIHERRLRFLTQLRITPAVSLPPAALTAASLYANTASVDAVEAESLGLRALSLPPLDLGERVRACLAPIRNLRLQSLYLLRLARHALAFEEERFDRYRDRTAPLETVRQALSVDSDESLACLTPAVVSLGAVAGRRQALAEFEEGAWRLASLDKVAWPARREALEDLLTRLEGVFFPAGEKVTWRRRRAAGQALTVFARLPLRLDDGPSRAALRHRWHEILPMVVAVADRLPGGVPSGWARHLAEGMVWRAAEGVEPVAATLLDLCQRGPEDRLRAAERLLASTDRAPVLLEGLSYLLTASAPGRVLELLASLPAAIRDPLGVRLLRFGWLRGEVAVAVPALLEDAGERAEAAAWLGSWEAEAAGEEERWCTDLGEAVVEGELDPSSPGCEPLLLRLWRQTPEQSRPVLARAVLRALATGGRSRGENALRFWLHAHLHPRPGRSDAAREALIEAAQGAVRKALSLEGGSS